LRGWGYAEACPVIFDGLRNGLFIAETKFLDAAFIGESLITEHFL